MEDTLEQFIPIVERLGSLGILVLMVWRAPAIIGAIQSLIGNVVDTISKLQDKQIISYEKQQEIERQLMSSRFEAMERSMERMGTALETSIRTQTEVLHRLDSLERSS